MRRRALSLSAAARPRADAGDEHAVRLPGGESTTPAFKVLELLRELGVRHAELRGRAVDHQVAEARPDARLLEPIATAAHVRALAKVADWQRADGALESSSLTRQCRAWLSSRAAAS